MPSLRSAFAVPLVPTGSGGRSGDCHPWLAARPTYPLADASCVGGADNTGLVGGVQAELPAVVNTAWGRATAGLPRGQSDGERLVSYAIDLGTEVSTKPGNNTARITSVKAVKEIISTHTVVREERVYNVANRSTTDRTLLIELPNRKGEGFTFIGNNKPKEEVADVYRFEVPVGAKKDLSYTVTEERPVDSLVQLTNNADDQIRYFINLKEAPEGLKEKLREALTVKGTWDKARQDTQAVNTRVQAITADQKRLRENLRETPKESPLFQRYLKTLEEQEKEMDDLSAKLKALHGDEAKAKADTTTSWPTCRPNNPRDLAGRCPTPMPCLI